jgi:putative ABC transport system substrate-binding protein
MADKGLDVLVMDGHSDPHPKMPVVTKLSGVAGSALAQSKTRNITGITREHGTWEEDSKRVALLREALGAERVVLLTSQLPGPGVKPGMGSAEDLPPGLRDAARKLGVAVLPVVITKPEDLEPAFKLMGQKPRTAVITYDSQNWYKVGASIELTSLMISYRKCVPSMSVKPEWVMVKYPDPEMETIIAFGTSYLEEHERYSYFVDRILRGTKPAELAFEQMPNRLAVNVEAAREAGITFPPSILTQAEYVVPPHPRFVWSTTHRPGDAEEPPPGFRRPLATCRFR